MIRKWAPAARRRGGQWELEALLFTCGPIAATLTSFYPSEEDGGPGYLGMVNRLLTDASYVLSLVAIVRGLACRGRSASGVLTAVLAYYLALIFSGIGGVVPGLPEAYWLTPLIVVAFILNEGCTLAWFVASARMVLRSIVALSLLSMAVVPELAFNLDDSRSLFGIHRLAGITPHPNMLGILAALGFAFELSHRASSIHLWRVAMFSAVLLSQSSMAYIAAMASALLLTGGIAKTLRRLLFVGVAVGSLLAILDTGIAAYLGSALTPEEITRLLNGRTGIWEAALMGFYLNPVWGYGPSLLSPEYRAVYLQHFDAAAQAHNQWVQTLGEAGLVGITTLSILTVALLIRAFRGRLASRSLSVALVVALLINSISETPLRPQGLSVGTLSVIIVVTVVVLSKDARSTPIPGGVSEKGLGFASLALEGSESKPGGAGSISAGGTLAEAGGDKLRTSVTAGKSAIHSEQAGREST